jgi:hypothetical protein
MNYIKWQETKGLGNGLLYNECGLGKTANVLAGIIYRARQIKRDPIITTYQFTLVLT